MATKTFKIGLSTDDKSAMAQDVYERLIAMCFDEYDSTKVYNAGDFVVYENPADTFKLYKCKEDNVTGTWNSAKWELATFQDLVDDVEGAVDSVADKANVDGNYQTMTVGLANNFDSKLVENDQSAYNFRPTATMGSVELEVGSPCKVKKIIGGTVAFNQQAKELNNTNWYGVNASASFSNGVATFTTTQQYGGLQSASMRFVSGHKYLLSAEIKLTTASNIIKLVANDGINNYVKETSLTTDSQTLTLIAAVSNSSASSYIKIQDNRSSDWDAIQVKNIIFIDLTQMFGATIADYIYTLETGTAGAGVAWFKRYFNKPYYAYNAGTLVSVKTRGKKVVGFNQLSSTHVEQTTSAWAAVLYGSVELLPNTSYCLSFVGVSGNALALNEKIFSGWTTITANGSRQYVVGTTLANLEKNSSTYNDTYGWALLKNNGASSVTPNFTEVCLNFHYDGERDGEYEPYETETYAIEDIELLGIPKLDSNNNLVFDGDEYASSGSVVKKYGIVDLGTLTYSYESSPTPRFITTGLSSLINRQSGLLNVICPLYKAANDYSQNKTLWVSDGGNISIHDESYTDAATFKTAMSGVYLVYELANPTENAADAFTETQECNNWGTEEFLAPTSDTRPCEVPVGHDTDYLPDLKAKVESAPTTPSDDGYYILQHDESAEGNPNSYADMDTVLASKGYVTQVDLSNNITDIAGLTYTFKKLYKTGNVVTLSIQAINETGSSIAAGTKLFQLPSGTFVSGTNINVFARKTGSNTTVLISWEGKVSLENDALSNNDVLNIYVSYAVA